MCIVPCDNVVCLCSGVFVCVVLLLVYALFSNHKFDCRPPAVG